MSRYGSLCRENLKHASISMTNHKVVQVHCLRCSALFSNHFTTDLLLSLLVKHFFLNLWTFGEVRGKKLLTDHLSYAKAFCCNIFLLCCSRRVHSYCGNFSMATLLVSELNNAKIIVRNFSTTVLSGWVLNDSLLHSDLEHSNFLNTDISQGSAATQSCFMIFAVLLDKTENIGWWRSVKLAIFPFLSWFF